MRIAMVILHVDPSRGGAERYTLDLAQAMASRGHQVDLLCSTPEGMIPYGLRAAANAAAGAGQVQAISLASNRSTRSGRYLSFLAQVDECYQRGIYDVFHAMLPVRRCDVYHPHAGLAAAQISSGHQKHPSPILRLCSAIGNRLNLRRQLFSRTEHQLLTGPKPPIVLSLSDYVRAEVDEHYHLPAECHATLYNGVDLARFDPQRGQTLRARSRQQLGLVASDIVALFMGQDPVRKGLPAALSALARIDRPELKLLVVGNPPAMVSPTALNKMGLAGRVFVAGQVADPIPSYAAADFLVLPTFHDPCPLVVLEALAMGLPVISTMKNGACELMADGVHGHVLPDPGNVPELVSAMKNLLDPETRARMVEAIQPLWPKLSYTAHVERICATYQRALERRGAR